MIKEIWSSYRRLPGWVQIWVAVILVPVNAAAIFFVDEPLGDWVAGLAVCGFAVNGVTLLVDRGFGKLMALPHLIMWTPLVILIATILWGDAAISGPFRIYLWVLLVVDLISLAFDYPDFRKWLKGERGPA